MAPCKAVLTEWITMDKKVKMKMNENECDLLNFEFQAEEMIKEEMLKMVRNDVVTHPNLTQQSLLSSKKTRGPVQGIINANRNALKADPLEKFTDEELANAKKLLKEEIEVVKKIMGHGDINLDVYTKVWEECYGQVSQYRKMMFLQGPRSDSKGEGLSCERREQIGSRGLPPCRIFEITPLELRNTPFVRINGLHIANFLLKRSLFSFK